MSSSLQTLLALGLVLLAGLFLLHSWSGKKRAPGCGADCGAVSPEIKRLQARLKP